MEEIILKYRKKIIAGLALGLVLALSFGVLSPALISADTPDYTLILASTAGGSVTLGDGGGPVHEGEFGRDYDDPLQVTAEAESGFDFIEWEIPEGAEYDFNDITSEGEVTDATINIDQDSELGEAEISLTARFSADDEVSVSTRLMAWLNFQVDPSINLHELVTADGTTQLGYGYSKITLGTNNTTGWAIQMRGSVDCGAAESHYGECASNLSALFGSEANYYIPSLAARDEITAGSDDYGALVQPLVGSGGECINLEDATDAGDVERCDNESDTFWDDGSDSDIIPRGYPTIEEATDGGGDHDYTWAAVDGDTGFVAPIRYPNSRTLITSDLPHDFHNIARFHIRAAASAMAPSDQYTDNIVLTAMGNIE